MSGVPYVPNEFKGGDNLDLEKLNDNLEAISRSVQRNLDARYTYSTISLPLAGITNASAQVLRELAIRRPGTNNVVEVFAAELVLYTNAAVTASLTVSHNGTLDTTWPALTATTSATTATEVTASSGIPVSIPSSTTDSTFTLAFSGAVTVTAGEIRLHLRCDRGNQGTSHAGYFPPLLTSADTDPATTLNTYLTNLETAVTHDTTNAVDLRCELFAMRALVSTTTRTLQVPSGQRKILRVQAYCVAAVGRDLKARVSGTVTTISVDVTAAGATVRATAGAGPGAVTTASDDPMTVASDQSYLLIDTGAAGDHLLDYMLVWWS